MTRRNPRPIRLLIPFTATLTALAWLTTSTSPDRPFTVIMFFILSQLTLLFFFLLVLNRIRLAVLASCGITVWLILRYLNLREPVYIALLLAVLISLELTMRKS